MVLGMSVSGAVLLSGVERGKLQPELGRQVLRVGDHDTLLPAVVAAHDGYPFLWHLELFGQET
jgi:hypothetical protein